MTTTTAILLKHLDVKSKSGFEWLCLCPYHEDKTPSFSINIRKRLFICYACGAKGNMAQLLEHLGLSTTLEEEEVSLDELTAKVRSVGVDVARTQRPPVGFPIPARAYSSSDDISNYWFNKRNLSHSAIEKYNLGFDSLNDEAIIPVRDFNGHTIGMIRRTFDPSRPRYLYSKGMKTSEVVFGAYEALQLAKKNVGKKGILVVTEGSVDAMSVYDMTESQHHFHVGVAMLGSRMSKTQAQIIRKLGFEEIIIATDMDRAGKTAQIQVNTILKDVRAGAFIYNAEWADDWGKDLNSLTDTQMMTVLRAARGSVYDRLIPNIISTTNTSSTSGSRNTVFIQRKSL